MSEHRAEAGYSRVAAWFAPGQSRNAVSELITDGVNEATRVARAGLSVAGRRAVER